MIDISVSSLVKSFELGKNILDGLTFTVNSGERVGILGHNGCGKTTLFRILAGEIGWDEGEVMVAPSKRLGLISQIPVYPEGCTVEAVLETAFQRVRRIEKEMKELEEQMAAGNASRTVMERYDKLSTDFELAGGYDTAVQVNKICNGLGIPDALRLSLRRRADPGEPGSPHFGGHRHLAAGRAHQPLGSSCGGVAGKLSERLPRHRPDHLP